MIWLRIEGYRDNKIHYHLFMLHDAGLIEGMDMSNSQGCYFCIRRIAWAGHEFLEAGRDDGRWQAVTAQMERAGGSVFHITKRVLVAAMERQVGLTGGDSAP